MNDVASTISPNNTTVNKSEITKNEKMILGALLFILSVLLIVISPKILPKLFPIPHNSIIVGDVFHPYYAFNIDQSRKTNNPILHKIGNEAEWSPNGQWIVFSREESIGNGFGESRIYIIRTDGSQKTYVPLPYGGEHPTWSPDGKKIAFYQAAWWTEDGPVLGAGIYIANIECLLQGYSCAPEIRLLVKQPEHATISSPDWSPDGKNIVYAGTNHISIVNVYGESRSVDLTPYSGKTAEPRWSPDGTKIVGVCNFNICVMNRDGSNLTYLTNNTTYRRISYPRWSPDGQMIAYISSFSNKPIRELCLDGGCPLPTSVFIMNAYGGEITHLPLEDNVVIYWFFWYP